MDIFKKPMTKLLAIINRSNDRAKLIQNTSIIGIITNLGFALIKVVIGLMANSVSIISDAINNFTDSVSAVITLLGSKFANKAPDYKHPFGYGRIEYISSLVVAAIVLVFGLEFMKTSFLRIQNPEAINFTILQIVLLILTILGKIFLSRLDVVVGETTNSLALKASGKEAMMDVLASTLTVVAAIVSVFTGWLIDGYVGLLLSIFIIYTGISLIRETVNSIIGIRPEKQLVENIREELIDLEPIMGAYDFIVHNYGPSTQFGTANLEIPENTTVKEVYATMLYLQDEIYRKYHIYFTFGIYSVNTYDDKVKKVQSDVYNIVTSIPHTINIHAFNLDNEEKRIRFDVVVDFEVRDFAKFRRELQDLIKLKYPEYSIIINIDLDYS